MINIICNIICIPNFKCNFYFCILCKWKACILLCFSTLIYYLSGPVTVADTVYWSPSLNSPAIIVPKIPTLIIPLIIRFFIVIVNRSFLYSMDTIITYIFFTLSIDFMYKLILLQLCRLHNAWACPVHVALRQHSIMFISCALCWWGETCKQMLQNC